MKCTLNDCPPGLFLFYGELCFKSEYRSSKGINISAVDAYVVETGEYFTGGTSDFREREKLMVEPVKAPNIVDLEPLNDDFDEDD